MLIRSTLAVAASLAFLLQGPSPVVADCEMAGPIERVLPKADVAFVGTVTRVDGAVATLAVREVWAGDVADTVVVRGFFDDLGGVGRAVGAGGALGEDERRWTAGSTYLVVPWVDGAVLRDSICTATTEWSDELGALRPATARVVEAEPAVVPSVPPAVLALGGALLLVTVVSVIAFRRGERPR